MFFFLIFPIFYFPILSKSTHELLHSFDFPATWIHFLPFFFKIYLSSISLSCPVCCCTCFPRFNMFIFSSWFLYIYLIYLRIKVHCFVSFTFLFSRILDSKSHFQSSPSIFFLATLLFPSPLPQTILKIIYKLQLLFMLGEISATTGSKSQICVDILNDFRSAGGRVENVSNEKKKRTPLWIVLRGWGRIENDGLSQSRIDFPMQSKDFLRSIGL